MSSDVPYRADVTATTAQILEDHDSLEVGEETAVVVSIAGRLMLRRDQGRLSFGVL